MPVSRLAPIRFTPAVVLAAVALTSCTTASRVARMPLAAMREAPPTDVDTTAVAVGAEAPTFTLPAQDGQPWSLAEALQKGPVVVVFYRGDWCPYCRSQLAELQTFMPQLRERHAQVVGIAPDGVERYAVLHEELGLGDGFDLLHDEGAAVIQQYGVYDAETETAWPALYVLTLQDGQPTVHWRSLAETYKKREAPKAILQALATIK